MPEKKGGKPPEKTERASLSKEEEEVLEGEKVNRPASAEGPPPKDTVEVAESPADGGPGNQPVASPSGEQALATFDDPSNEPTEVSEQAKQLGLRRGEPFDAETLSPQNQPAPRLHQTVGMETEDEFRAGATAERKKGPYSDDNEEVIIEVKEYIRTTKGDIRRTEHAGNKANAIPGERFYEYTTVSKSHK